MSGVHYLESDPVNFFFLVSTEEDDDEEDDEEVEEGFDPSLIDRGIA